jgi:hypothetical protein
VGGKVVAEDVEEFHEAGRDVLGDCEVVSEWEVCLEFSENSRAG